MYLPVEFHQNGALLPLFQLAREEWTKMGADAELVVLSTSGKPLMRRGRGSTREYVQRDNLEPRARCGGAPARQAGGAATRGSATSATQPIQLPTHSDRSPPPTARIGSKLGRNIEHWWYDRSPANWSAAIPRSPAITQDIY